MISLEAADKVSIVVTCRNNEETIGECLQAINNQEYPKDFIEVIVIDACSTDRTVEIAKNYATKVFSAPLNAAAAYNYAMKIVAYNILGFVDADAKVESQWLRKLLPHLTDDKVAGVSGSIETWNPDNLWARSIGYEIKNRYQRIKNFTGRIATMNLLMKKSVIEEVGGWDEGLPSQYDTDFGYRIASKGYKFAYEPNAKCFHYNRTTLSAYWRQQVQYGKNTLKLYLKHSSLARGDEITDLRMNIQPPLLLSVIALFLLGLIPLFRALWLASGLLMVGIVVYYIASAVNISIKFKDRTAMALAILFFVRAVAWLWGAVITTLRFISGDRR